ncbi:MAG: sigma-70 family RNA polymerase sigma factor [Oligoflexales bacterium]
MHNLNSPVSYMDQASLNRLTDKQALDQYLRKENQQDDYDQNIRFLVSPKLKNDLHHILKELPSKEQEIIRLRYWEDYTCSEIAKDLGLDEALVKKRLTEALTKLRKKIIDNLVKSGGIAVKKRQRSCP